MLKQKRPVGVARILVLLNICFLSVFVAGENQLCRASSCGDTHNISDPFRLKGDPSGCGDGRYELSCKNNRTVLSLYGGKYYVAEINYEKFSIRVVDPGLRKSDCFSTPRYHLAPENFSFDQPFAWPYDWEFRTTVLMDCSRPISNTSFVPITPCNSTNSTALPYHYALTGGSLQVGDLPGSCMIGKTIYSKLDEEVSEVSEPRNQSVSSLQDDVLVGIELSFLQIRCIRQCRVKGQYCYMNYISNEVKCDDPNACKEWSECFKPVWLRYLILYALGLIGLIFFSKHNIVIASILGGRAILGMIFLLALVIYKLRQKRLSKDTTTEEIP